MAGPDRTPSPQNRLPRPAPRLELVQAVRERLASGYYDDPAVATAAALVLLREVRRNGLELP